MKGKHTGSLLLALLLMAGAASGCAEKTGNGSDTEELTSEGPLTIYSGVAETELSDELPEVRYDGYTFNIASVREESWIALEEAPGEVLQDAIYNRNTAVEERFGIDIQAVVCSTYTDVGEMLRKTVTSNTVDELDTVFIQMVQGASLTPEGYYYPLNDMSYIHLEKPWWDSGVSAAFSVGGKLFLGAGDILSSTMLRTSCLAFNKSLFDARSLPYPYELAYNGQWTLDELYNLTRDVTGDLNGDGKVEEKDDLFGMTSWYLDSPYSFYYGAGGTIIAKDADDLPVLNMDVETNHNIYMKLYDIFIENSSNYHTDTSTYEMAYTVFTEGRALFCETYVHKLAEASWRNMEQDYGIVPMPKYDAEQENYLSFVNGCAPVVGVPTAISDPDRTSVILEAMAATSYKRVTPTLYEITAKTKHTRDEESADMIEMVLRNRVFDFGYSHMNGSRITQFVRDLLCEKSTNVASVFAANAKVVDKQLSKLIEAYQKNTMQ